MITRALPPAEIELRWQERLRQRLRSQAQSRGLTPRQTEVVLLIAEGYANKQIADKLFISENTVKNNVSLINQHLGTTTRTQLVLHLLGLMEVA